jgi:signal transduction histidine kinase
MFPMAAIGREPYDDLMTDSPAVTIDVQPIEKVLLWIVLAFRVLGYLWLLLLVGAALFTDESADKTTVVVMAVGAGAWTLLTVVLSRTPDRLKRPWFVVADGIVALLVASTSYYAGAESNLHGGYPISWLAVVAYASDVRWTMAASIVLFLNQWIGMDIEGSRNLTDKLGAVVFPIYGAIVGYGFDLVRQRDSLWRQAEEELRTERRHQIRHQEQLALADQLHDSVLQSLHAIQVEPTEAEQVAYIARRQERELRRTIHSLRSEHDDAFVTAMFTARDDVEDLYRVQIEMVCGWDAAMTSRLTGLVEATREAMINAAKHSGSDIIRVHCAAERNHVTVLVRDQGMGFDIDRDASGHGIPNSIMRRMESIGGTATIQSTEEFGTEVEMTLPMEV